jgi:hypothetical protein
MHNFDRCVNVWYLTPSARITPYWAHACSADDTHGSDEQGCKIAKSDKGKREGGRMGVTTMADARWIG